MNNSINLGQPGSLDGPPAKPSLADRVGAILGMITGGLVVAAFASAILVAIVWSIAWMIANFPA